MHLIPHGIDPVTCAESISKPHQIHNKVLIMLHIVSDKFHVVWTSKEYEDLLVSSHTDYEQALNAADNLIQDSYSYRLFPKGHVRISHSHAFDK